MTYEGEICILDVMQQHYEGLLAPLTLTIFVLNYSYNGKHCTTFIIPLELTNK